MFQHITSQTKYYLDSKNTGFFYRRIISLVENAKLQDMIMKKTFILLTALVFSLGYSQQEPSPHDASATEQTHGMKGSTRFTFGLGHTHVSEGKIDGDTKWLVIPSFSFNFDYC